MHSINYQRRTKSRSDFSAVNINDEQAIHENTRNYETKKKSRDLENYLYFQNVVM